MKQYLIMQPYLLNGRYVSAKQYWHVRLRIWLIKLIWKTIKHDQPFEIKTTAGKGIK